MNWDLENPVVRYQLWDDRYASRPPKYRGYWSSAKYDDEDYPYDEDERAEDYKNDSFCDF